MSRRRTLVLLSSLNAVVLLMVAWTAELLFDAPVPVGVAAAGCVVAVPVVVMALSRPPLNRHADVYTVRSVVWIAAGALVTLTYVVVVVGLTGRPRDGERWVLLTSIAAAIVIAAGTSAFRGRVTALANEYAYGHRRSPTSVVDDFARRLTQSLPRDEQLLRLAESLRSSLGASLVEIWTGEHGLLTTEVSLPHAEPRHLEVPPDALPVIARSGVVGEMWTQVWLPSLLRGDRLTIRLVAATHGGELLGLILVGREDRAVPYTSTDERLLAELGPRLGLALQTMKLDAALRRSLEEVRDHAAELERSRARLVLAADTERRRIERDLHDGAQQRLIALGMKVAMASKAIYDDPDRAAALVEEVKAEVKESAAELRALSHGIYPATLQAEGLVAAMPDAIRRFPFDITFESEGIERYDPSIEAAVYFCCLEALQNAAKHAGEDPRVVIRLCGDEGTLRFSVSDDGPGFQTTGGDGQGLIGMRDRAGAVGGTVTIESMPGHGTTVRGTIPVRAR